MNLDSSMLMSGEVIGRRPIVMRWPLLSLCAAVMLLAGCSTASPHRDAATLVSLPLAYRNADAAQAATNPSQASGTAVRKVSLAEALDRSQQGWWRVFGSRKLDRLIDQALANNRDLRIATIQVAQAKLRADQVDADGKPRLSAPLQVAGQAPGGQVGAVPVSGGGSVRPQSSLQTSLQAAWQPDLWGERQQMAESAEFQVWRAVYDRENVQRNLIANVVTTYINYLMANDAVRLGRDSVVTGRGIVLVLEQRLAASDATADEVEQKRAALYTQQMAMPGLELQREEARSGLALLVGSVSAELVLADDGIDSLTVPEVVAELPSSLLFRRPDIRAVEARMKSANADIGVARARMLPALNLTSQLGLSGAGVLQLLQPQNLFWNLISGMTVSIFDGGRKQADKDLSQANYEEMVEVYARTVLQAVREVEGALAGLRSAREQLAMQRQITGSGLQMVKLSETGFGVGSVDRTTLLETMKTYQRSIEDDRRRRADYLKSNVSLYLALGAGAGRLWSDEANAADQFERFEALAEAEMFDSEPGGPAGTGWQVALPGVYHQAIVPAVWRDLNARYPNDMRGRGLRVRPNGRVEAQDDQPQAWHQLFVTRFPDKDDAERFCRSLRSRQQQCAVEAAGGKLAATGAARSFIARITETATLR